MKTTVLYLLIGCVLSSCGTYNYLTISHASLQASDKKFTAADSTLRVSYSFVNMNGILNLSIENHSAGPVTIDWKKSSLVTNGRAVSLYNGNMPFNASAGRDSLVHPPVVNINGMVSLPSTTDFIPPAAVISKSTIAAISSTYNFPFAASDMITKTGSMHEQKKFPGKQYKPTESPYKIRVYLTYINGDGHERVLENEFYVSEVINTMKGPDAMQAFFNNNQSYICSFVLNPADNQPNQY
ncbi:MAG: hypothetical protein U0V75_07605 [Ferruginibacter sp.]